MSCLSKNMRFFKKIRPKKKTHIFWQSWQWQQSVPTRCFDFELLWVLPKLFFVSTLCQEKEKFSHGHPIQSWKKNMITFNSKKRATTQCNTHVPQKYRRSRSLISLQKTVPPRVRFGYLHIESPYHRRVPGTATFPVCEIALFWFETSHMLCCDTSTKCLKIKYYVTSPTTNWNYNGTNWNEKDDAKRGFSA